MDDLILRVAIWQDDHWTDRLAFLDCGPQNTAGAAKVVLVFLPSVIEYMLIAVLTVRLQARARQLDAANEKDIAAIMQAGK